jgi:hypothetical protein
MSSWFGKPGHGGRKWSAGGSMALSTVSSVNVVARAGIAAGMSSHEARNRIDRALRCDVMEALRKSARRELRAERGGPG